jgi:hypothetical protein
MHVPMEMDSWKPTHYGTRFLGFENERCFHGGEYLETNMSLRDQQAFPWTLIRYIRGRSDRNEVIPCGGGVEYLHRSPTTRRRRRKGTQWLGV